MSCRAIEEAVLLTCDVPMIRYIQHIDQERSRETNLDSFVLRKLDDTHLYVRPDVVQMLRGKIKELQVCAPPEHCAPRARHMPTPHACACAAVAQDSNTFKDTREAGSGLVADADAPTSKPPAKKRKVTQDKAVTAAGSTTIRLPALPGSGSAGGAAAAEAPRNFTPGLRGDG